MARRSRQGTKAAGFEGRFRLRLQVVAVSFALAGLAIAGRAVQLQFVDQAFLARQADARHLRVASIPAHRGSITDRNGEPLAVSSPVDSIWVNPGAVIEASDRLPELAAALERPQEWLLRRVTANADRDFLYLKRHIPPERAEAVLALGIHGVYSEREYRRYYPSGEVVGHLTGFTNIDDDGQEGLELAYNHWLAGQAGARRVLRDRLGHTIEDVEQLRPARPGRDLRTSIDLRLQYLAYRALKAQVAQHRARTASLVVLDVRTGEVLAMVNQPGYNPNDRAQYHASRYRNRAATDIFEPGSAIKPLIVAAGLESGRYRADSVLDTSPGYFSIGRYKIEDKHNLGRISITTVLTKSSNVGASRIALSMEPADLWSVLDGFGLGHLTDSGFPGESAGLMNHYEHWREIGQAVLAYGYGVSVTPLQLAQSYAVLGAGGLRRPVSLLAVDAPPPAQRVVSPEVARAVVAMMETVVSREGTALKAAVPGYRVAGKTGTAHKAVAGGYDEHSYTAVFGGLVPVSDPRLAIVAVVQEPSNGKYYGGDVAAPVFAEVAAGALRILGIAPDDLPPPAGDDVESPRLVQAMRTP
jgi:cell division protein FtsI (penicillin-binding protein 3)